MNDIDPNRIFFEKNIRDILRTYRKGFQKPLKNTYISVACFCLIATALFVSYSIDGIPRTYTEPVGSMVNFSVTFSAAGLGVMIAGFSIVASSLDVRTFEILSNTDYENTGVPNLNFIFSCFVGVLIMFLNLFWITLSYYLFISESSLFISIFSISNEFRFVMNQIFLSIVVSYQIFVLLSVRSFVWNLHQSLLAIGTASSIVDKSKGKKVH